MSYSRSPSRYNIPLIVAPLSFWHLNVNYGVLVTHISLFKTSLIKGLSIVHTFEPNISLISLIFNYTKPSIICYILVFYINMQQFFSHKVTVRIYPFDICCCSTPAKISLSSRRCNQKYYGDCSQMIQTHQELWHHMFFDFHLE